FSTGVPPPLPLTTRTLTPGKRHCINILGENMLACPARRLIVGRRPPPAQLSLAPQKAVVPDRPTVRASPRRSPTTPGLQERCMGEEARRNCPAPLESVVNQVLAETHVRPEELRPEERAFLEQHALKKPLRVLDIWALGVGVVVAGAYFGWNLGLKDNGP